MEYVIGIIAYILYFMYDYNSIHKQRKILKTFFLLGTILLVGSTVYATVKYFKYSNLMIILISSICGLLFLALLIYTLFFAIPFDSTYVYQSEGRLAYTKGMYSVCRHPGMLWFLGLYICLSVLTYNPIGIWFYGLMILGDLFYIIYQDYYIFPLTFVNYAEYKKTTPFLIPFLKRRKHND